MSNRPTDPDDPPHTWQVASGEASKGEGSHTRVLKLIEFLREYDALQHPPVRDIATYNAYRLEQDGLPSHSAIKLNPHEETWLQVQFVELPAPPPVPEELVSYFESTDLSPAEPPATATMAPGLEDDLETWARGAAAAAQWTEATWRPWSEAYAEASVAKTFYRRLFDQMQLVADNRDSLELVWGFARLKWTTQGHRVSHPLFVIPVEIDLQKDRSLAVVPSGALELDTLCLANLDIASRATLSSRRELLDDTPFDPRDPVELRNQAREIVRLISNNGVVEGEGAASANEPAVDTSWVLFMRRKRPDYQGFLDLMRDIYSDGHEAPLPLRSLVVDEPMNLTEGESDRSQQHQELLLPLPANGEQQRILEVAQDHSGVVVQGPPGTGKSHTIANLISHYVAHGQRVLVVAEKEQALRVLADKIPAGIRDLTVSVLGADADGRRQLESSITAIQAGVSQIDPSAHDRSIEDLTRELAQIDSQIAETTGALLATRRSEVEKLPGRWPCGQDPTPEAAARWLASEADRLNVVPDAVGPGQDCPLTPGDLAELTRLVGEIGTERASSSAFALPNLEVLPSGQALKADVAEIARLEGSVHELSRWIADEPKLSAAGPDRIRDIHRHLAAELVTVKRSQAPWLTVISQAQEDGLQRRDWQEFEAAVKQDRQQVYDIRPQLAASVVEVPENPAPGLSAQLQQAKERLSSKGKLGWFAGDIKEALSQCRVDGHAPTSSNEVQLCLLKLELDNRRRALAQRWKTQIEPVGGPELDPARPEDELGSHLDAIDLVRQQPTRWEALRSFLRDAGISCTGSGTIETLTELVEATEALSDYFALATLKDNFRNLDQLLADGSSQERAGASWLILHQALSDRDFERWQAERERVKDLSTVAPAAVRMTELAERLAGMAPIWTQRILENPADAGDPAGLYDYWAWRQLETWVASVIASGSPAALQIRLEELARLRLRKVAEIVELRAWRRLQGQIRDPQRQALNAYIAAMKAHGKTGGKYKARWLREIRDALNRSKEAVPVWIMPAARALASFRPEKEAPFDVLIIDEASQLGIDAIPLLSLAKKAIVVGDDKQTSPSAVGINQGDVHVLINTLLAEVPNAKVMFNPGNSLYDLAFQKFPSPVMLVEHFRSLPEIIEFSNRHIYNGKIEPLRDQRPSPTWQALGAVKVLDGYRAAQDVNPNEASVVTDLVTRIVDDPACAGKSIGVVCLLSTSGQSELVRRLLFDRLGPTVMGERRIRVGDAANFQGDERDIMVVSLVVGTDPNNPTRGVGAMTGEGSVQRINVAASRARDQMWLVYSVDPERFPQGDLRAALIRHCIDPHNVEELLEDQLAKCDSEFERDVLRRIVARGYQRVRSQVHVGAQSNRYRIDLVVDGPMSRLAVECDGDAWHGENRWHADRERQEILERAGWTFERIRGSAYYRDPDDALRPLWARLEALGIPTGEEWLTEDRGASVIEVRGSELNGELNASEEEPEINAEESFSPDPEPAIPTAQYTSAPTPPSIAAIQDPLPVGVPTTTSSASTPAFPTPPATSASSQASPRPRPESTPSARAAAIAPDSRPAGVRADTPEPRGSSTPRSSERQTKSDLNRALAKALRDLGKPANGDTWMRAKKLVQGGKSVEDAAREV